MHLHTQVRVLHRMLRRQRLRDAGVVRHPLVARVLGRGGLPDHRPRRLDPDGHVGEHRRNRLVLDDRDPERVALVGVFGCLGERALGEADCTGGDERAGDLVRRDG